MASVALAFAGQAIGFALGGPLGATIGGAIGGMIGGLVDNVLFPPKSQRPNVDMHVQASTYGNGIAIIFGPENRVAGNVIWSSGLIEHKKKGPLGKGGPAASPAQYTYSVHAAVALCEGEITAITKIWANTKCIFDVSSNISKVYQEFRVYTGDFDQLPDPTIESYLGMGNVPAYRGTAYVVIVGLQLADYGNRLPNLEFLVERQPAQSVASVAREIVTRAGMDPMLVSYGKTPEQDVRGYVLNSPTNADAALQPLALCFNFDIAEQGGGLRLIERGLAPRAVIPVDDLGGRAPSDNTTEPLHWTESKETDLPRQSVLSFIDPRFDFQINSTTAIRTAGTSNNDLTTQVQITLEAPEARAINDRLLWEAWNARNTATGAVTDRWLSLLAGGVYLVETPAGGLEPLRILTRTRGANGVLQFEASREYTELYRSTAPGQAARLPPNDVQGPGITAMVAIDCPILRDADDDTGFYIVADGFGAGWRGADILRSTDGGTSYVEVNTIGSGSFIGTITGTLGDGPVDFWDRGSVITVTLDNDQNALETLSELAVLNGGNGCWVGPASGEGGEVLQFATAVEVSPGVWELSDLLRGRLGTEYAVASHGASELFVLLGPPDLIRPDFGPSDWNKTRLYKPVSLLDVEADTASQSFTNTGEGKRPYSVVHIAGVRDGSHNLTLSWLRRSRLRQPGLGNGLVPLGESVESYEIDILNPSQTAVARTIAAAAPTAAYSAADQATDGYSAGAPVHLNIYQISDVRGRGHVRFATV